MNEKITTIEDLAALMVETMASKEDVKELREEMNERFETVGGRLDHLDARAGRIEADVHALRDEILHRREFEDVLGRVKYIAKKLGIESGV